MTNKEKLIVFLNNELTKSNTNKVSISKNDIEAIGISEREIVQILCILHSEKYIEITRKSVHDDLSSFWSVNVLSSCIDYFDNQKAIKKNNRNAKIQFWIPTVISLGALIVSIIALIIG